MRNRLVVLTALLTVALTSGCGALSAASAGPASGPLPTPSATVTSDTGSGETGDTGIPDPCTLLDEAEVAGLTGRPVTQVDIDGGTSQDVTRFCQWQQEGGQLAIFLSRTTPEDFQVTVAEAKPVGGVGQDAYAHSGHLFVLHGTVQIDVYSRGGSDQQNLADEKKVAKTLVPRI